MWIIEEKPGVFYNKDTRMLETEGGREIAAVYIDESGNLEISLMMNTNFLSDEGWRAVGFNGCENHVVAAFLLEGCGGVLEYQENRHSVSRDPGEKISIKVMMLEGYFALPLYEKVAARSFFSGLCSRIGNLFRLSLESKKEAVWAK